MPKKRQTGKGLSDVLNFVRDNKLISRGLGFIPHPGAQAAATIAAMAGLGKMKPKRKPRRKQTGRGIFGDLGSGIGSVFGGLGGGLGSVAHGLFGNGKKKTTKTKRNVLCM
jgi:hypothetical protein